MNNDFYRSLFVNGLLAAAAMSVSPIIAQTLDQATVAQPLAVAPVTVPAAADLQNLPLAAFEKAVANAHALARRDQTTVAQENLAQIDARAWSAFLGTDQSVSAAEPAPLLQLTFTVAGSLSDEQKSQLLGRIEGRFVNFDAGLKSLDAETFTDLTRALGSLGWARPRQADLTAQWINTLDAWKIAKIETTSRLTGSLRGAATDAAKQAQQKLKQHAEATLVTSGALAETKLEDAKRLTGLMGTLGWSDTQVNDLTASWLAASSDWRTASPRALSGLVDRLKSSDTPQVKQAKQQLRGYLETNFTSSAALGQMDVEGIRRLLPMMEMVNVPRNRNSDVAAAWLNATDSWQKIGPTLLDFYSQFLTGDSDQTKQARQKLRQYLETKFTTVEALKALDLQATRRMLKMLETLGVARPRLGEIAVTWIEVGGTWPEQYDNNVAWFMDFARMAPPEAFEKAKGQLAQSLTAPETTIHLSYTGDFREARSATPLDAPMREQLKGLLSKKEDGSAAELPAILLTWDAKQRGQLNQWMAVLDQKIGAPNTNPDVTASWYLAAAYARRIDASMPMMLAGVPYVQKALATAKSEPIRLTCVEYLFFANCEVEKFDEAKKVLSDAGQQQFASDASKTRLDQLTRALPRQQAAAAQADRNRIARAQDKQFSDRLAFLQQRYDQGVQEGASQQQLNLLQRMISDAKAQTQAKQ